MTRGACLSSHAFVMPHFSSVPSLKFSTSTSAFFTSCARTSWPAFTPMLSVSERLLRLTPRKYADSPLTKGGPQVRVSSPAPGGSTLITSAPMSPSICVHSGPARMRVRSSTRSPSSAPLGFSVLITRHSLRFLTHGGRLVQVLLQAAQVAIELALRAQAELLEVGRPPRQERIHPLLCLLRAPYMREQLHAVLPRRIEVIRLEIERFLGHAKRQRAVALHGL